MRTALIAALLVAAASSPSAYASVFKCVDGSGNITYTNDPAPSLRCERLRSDLPVSTVPATPQRPAGAAPRPGASSSPSFPRVSSEAQQARDSSRRQVLERELAAEQAAVAEARQNLAAEEARDAPEDRAIVATPEGTRAIINVGKREERLKPLRDQVELHERNIEALEREMRALR